jgi:hypothetical protein
MSSVQSLIMSILEMMDISAVRRIPNVQASAAGRFTFTAGTPGNSGACGINFQMIAFGPLILAILLFFNASRTSWSRIVAIKRGGVEWRWDSLFSTETTEIIQNSRLV